uniref:Uncharacterized protein n=1 Tax=Brassica oleracea TaxID=3712 RepID=A0A3P6EKU6_BRAOL|nr:unnamed protein product [Brassica oleracea]
MVLWMRLKILSYCLSVLRISWERLISLVLQLKKVLRFLRCLKSGQFTTHSWLIPSLKPPWKGKQ